MQVIGFIGGEVLKGRPSRSLILACESDSRGAYLAYSEEGVWHPVPEDREHHYLSKPNCQTVMVKP